MRRAVLTILWLATDALVYTGAYALAYFLRVGWILSSDLPLRTYLFAVLLTVPGWLFVMTTMRNFGLTRRQLSLQNFFYIAYASLIGMAGFALVFYFFEQSLFSRQLLLLAGVLSACAVFAWHGVYDRLQRLALRANPPVYPLLIIGTNREAQSLIESLRRSRSPFQPVAVLDGRGGGPKEIGGVPVLGKLNVLEDVIRKKHITHIVQCDCLEQSINLASVCRAHGLSYLLLPYTLGVVEPLVRSETLEQHPVIAVHHRNAWWEWFFR